MPFRRRRSQRLRPRNVTQSFKKVLNQAPQSRSAAVQTDITMVTGTDSVAAGQTGVTDSQVPTGSIIEKLSIQIGVTNLVSISSFVWLTIQHLRSGQSVVDAQAVGGNPQRNQVHLQLQRTVGQNQNRDFSINFKIPKKYQRVREGDKWIVSLKGDTVRTDAYMTIYKFFR